MKYFKNPFLSRVKIKNYRNFLDVDVKLSHKQVIIGENNIGKTNFLRAIQLILDRNFTDADRELIESDFHDSLDSPLVNGEEVEISIEIQGYEHNRKLLAQFADAAISDEPPTMKITYRYFPLMDDEGNIARYAFSIFKGINEKASFTSEDRSFINIYVIKALRDVERDLKGNRNSPLYKLIKQYEISTQQLQKISDDLRDAASGILELDEIVHVKGALTKQFSLLSGLQADTGLEIRPMDLDTERLLHSLQLYLGIKERSVSELSLGLGNILYIALMLLLIADKTILPIIDSERFESLAKEKGSDVLGKYYTKSKNDNYVLRADLADADADLLYKFMDQNNYRHQSFTILAVEEPESHVHPILQRLLYREVLHNSKSSVIFSSHSTHIASIAPIRSHVHMRRVKNASKIFSSVDVALDKREERDIERYLDANRGEIFFGKGIILVEGISEEYIVPASATLMGVPLDEHGIVVCNINSTNFRPYISLLNQLSIPWVLLTDGDYYALVEKLDKNGKTKATKDYHVLEGESYGYRGHEIITKILKDLKLLKARDIPDDFDEQDKVFMAQGCFIGRYTLEVDMMQKIKDGNYEIFKMVYAELITGGDEMRQNFEEEIDAGNFWEALKKIEGNISKGRFAQRLSGEDISGIIPQYVKRGIKSILNSVVESDE